MSASVSVPKPLSPALWTYRGRVVRVVDADTLVVSLDLGFHLVHTVHLRLAGIDASERGTQEGREATEFVRDWIAEASGHAGQDGWLIVTTGRDRSDYAEIKSFERYVGTVRRSGLPGTDLASDLASDLVLAGHAVPALRPSRPLRETTQR